MESYSLEQIRLVFEQVLHLEVSGEDPRLRRKINIYLDVREQLLLADEGIYNSASVLSPAPLEEHPFFRCAELELAVFLGLLISPALMIALVSSSAPLELQIFVLII